MRRGITIAATAMTVALRWSVALAGEKSPNGFHSPQPERRFSIKPLLSRSTDWVAIIPSPPPARYFFRLSNAAAQSLARFCASAIWAGVIL